MALILLLDWTDFPKHNNSMRISMNCKVPVALTLVCAVMSGGGFASGQTGPVGFEFLTVHGNGYSPVAARVHLPALAIGVFDTISGALVTDNQVNFSAVMVPGKVHVVEQNGPAGHRVVEVASFSGNTLTLAESGVITGESYTLRALWRLSELLTPTLVPEFNPVEGFNPETGDLVLIPNGTGGFKEYYYSVHPGQEGYFQAGTGAAEDPFIRYTAGILILRRGAGYDTVFSGELKVTETAIPISQKFSWVGSVQPVASLASLDLSASLQSGTEQTADIVWSQDFLSGQIRQYFHSDGSGPGLTAGWRLVGGGNVNQGSVEVSPGIAIRRRGTLPHTVNLKGIPGL